ncbi:hypothetical protein BX616_006351 [Lobosporangium transversale]|uniref:C2H2-type domain-containing protein n=1 Tax=Lobosporangium transversale TaxID=64571 RepID=A0A1Y2GPL1_9FUNG|nr:hypothetical protein BCR41DRAFT_395911 [Lobosporangium transversale]KAF9915351.1 hypothetical protein BX616_006351 [Lobosporangium transversale]ORZ16627.1 hypothetical protein BCR41DRAFT_395911 [Lobosporangium transversale]|eukprot:XP_021881562.1 hypothetical protein BCR41DRAFT_395911 [Lobosporangium transversale]
MNFYYTPGSIFATMDSSCTPSNMLVYNNHQLLQTRDTSLFEDSDSESSYSGTNLPSVAVDVHGNPIVGSNAMQLQQQQQKQYQQTHNDQPITYHYFCNFPTCDYHSARSDPVKRHRDTHYPDYKPYICNYCQSSSARRDSTREHCLKQHKDDSENAFRYDASIPKPEGWIASAFPKYPH